MHIQVDKRLHIIHSVHLLLLTNRSNIQPPTSEANVSLAGPRRRLASGYPYPFLFVQLGPFRISTYDSYCVIPADSSVFPRALDSLHFAMSRSALFVIDIQRELAQDPKTQIPHAERVCSAGDQILVEARRIIDSYRTEGQRSPSIIVFVQHEERPEDGTLLRDTEPWRLVFEPRQGVEEEVLVAKTTRAPSPLRLCSPDHLKQATS